MGALFGKQSPKKNTKKNDNIKLNSVPSQPKQDPYEIYDPNKYDDEAVEILRKEFKEDPETFILNLMFMSFMFFEDYREEIGILANTVSERGKKLNSELIQQHQKQLLMPDVILDNINKKVKYQQSRGSRKGEMEPLMVQRMYILHDTIEIEDKRDSVDYSRIDKPCYRADIEESKENKGFVKVHLLGTSGSHLNSDDKKRESADSACSTSSAKYDTSWPNKHEATTSSSSSGTQNADSGFTTESDYDYTRITAARTPRKLEISEKDIYTNISQLPSRCITPVKYKNEIESDDDSDEEDNRIPKKRSKQPSDLFKIHYYLNSSEFMLHFKDNVFPNYLGEVLDFNSEVIAQATSIPGAIYCDTKDDWGNCLQYEVLPAIAMPWPDDAYEWPIRRRVTVMDRREKKPIAYKWPTDKMLDETRKLNCVVIPKGYMPKKGNNPKMDIEWEICFPKAERYLELRMSHAQMRFFVYLITLHKTYIEPRSQKCGLLVDHLRMLMFWECEANYKAWPEDKLGTKLTQILKTLYDHLCKRHLSHYFIKSKNVLENVPGRFIVPTLEVINHIIESPVSYVLHALRHLKYTQGKFYPEPNLDELYDILTAENVLPSEAYLISVAQQQAQAREEAKRRNENNEKKQDREQIWNRRYLEQQRNANKKKLLSKNSPNSNQSKNLTLERKSSIHSINFEVPLKKRFETDIARQILLLTYFIQHFIQIAKRSFKISSTNQTLFYLKQAWYLTRLLENIDEENAVRLQNQIREEEENCQKRRAVEPKIPSTPKRNSSIFTYQSNEILQVKGKEINIANLNKSFNANTLSTDQKPSTSGVKKKTKRHIQSDTKMNTPEKVKSEIKPDTREHTNSVEQESTKNVTHKQVTVEIHTQPKIQTKDLDKTVELRKPVEVKEIKKSVSFRSQSNTHVKLEENDGDDESTSL